MNGIIYIAVGDPIYARLATVSAASIKKSSPYIQIAILYSEGILDELSPRQLELFDEKILVPIDAKGPEYTAMKLKVSLPNYTPFDNTIFLDSDTVMCPAHKIDKFFDDLKDIDFTIQNDGFQDATTDKDDLKAYPIWGDPEGIRKTYIISKETRIPKCHSSFIYFNKSYTARLVFTAAQKVFLDDNKFDSWRGVKPDELCFNVALALYDMHPHRYPFEPVYVYFKNEQRSKEYVIDNYSLITTIGTNVRDPRVISMYNDFMEYYFNYHGFRRLFKYQHKKYKTGDRKIYGFWHIYMVNNFVQVIEEQLNMMKDSGLYDAAEQIMIGLVGDKSQVDHVKNVIQKYHKLKIVTHKTNANEYEFPTLRIVKDKSRQKEDYHCFYIHTKGVSYNNHPGGKHWRDYMNYFTLTRWRRNIEKLSQGFDTSGVKWIPSSDEFMRHYSGNFWWATSEYIASLPEINTLNLKDRFMAEMWIGCGNPNAAVLSQLPIDYNNLIPFLESELP